MKATRIILGFALIALSTAASGQRTYLLERQFPNRDNHMAILSSDQRMESNPVDLWIYDNNGWARKKISYKVYEAPLPSMTIYFDQYEILYEEDLQTEHWMTQPFETLLAEPALTIESWMVKPFDEIVIEEELTLESWMGEPFEVKKSS